MKTKVKLKISKSELKRKLNIVDGKDGKDGIDGKDGSPDTGEKIVNKINELDLLPDLLIDAKHIRGIVLYPGGKLVPQSLTSNDSPTFVGLTLTGLTSGSVIFAGANGVLSQKNANLFWDNTNNRLGIGTSAPGINSMLDVRGNVSIPATNTLNLDGNTGNYQVYSVTAPAPQSIVTGNLSALGLVGSVVRTFVGDAGKLNLADASYNAAFTIFPAATSGTYNFIIRNRADTANLLTVDDLSRVRLGGTAIVTTDWALGAGWGANATVSAVAGTDSRGSVTVTTSTLDTPTANPILTLTFKNGTWTTAPFATANLDRLGTGLTGPVELNTTATTLVLQYIGTPTALVSNTYIFDYHVIG